MVKVWDVDTGDELRTFATECSGSLPQEHHIQFGDNLLGVSESCKHNGRAAERNDDHIVVYDVAAEKKVGRYPGNKVFAFSPDNKLVATCYDDRPTRSSYLIERKPRFLAVSYSAGIQLPSCDVIVWSVESGKKVFAPLHTYSEGASFSADSDLLATSSASATEVWRISDATKLGEFAGAFQGISPRGDRLTTLVDRWSQLKTASVIEIDGNTITLRAKLEAGLTRGAELTKLVSGKNESEVKIRITEVRSDGGALAQATSGNRETIQTGNFFFVGDPLEIRDFQRRRWAVVTWDLLNGKQLQREVIAEAQVPPEYRDLPLPASVPSSGLVNTPHRTFSPDGRKVAVGWGDAQLRIWDAVTGKLLHDLTGKSLNVFSLSFTADGKTLAAGEWDSRVKLWDLATGQQTREFRVHADRPIAAFSPDGKTLAACDYGVYQKGHSIYLWEVDSNAKREISNGPDHCWQLGFSSDGKTLATGDSPSGIDFWDVATASKARSLPGGPYFAFSPVGGIYAAQYERDSVSLRDLSSGAELRKLSAARPLAFSPDGKFIACYGSGKIEIWNVGTAELPRSFGEQVDALTSFAFSPNGKLLASVAGVGFRESDVRLWDFATGQELHRLVGHRGGVWSVAFSPDGKFLFTGGDDTTIKVWDPETGKELVSLVSFGDKDWVVITPDGLFDGTAGGMQMLHWVVGLEPIALTQLKERYWVPGLLSKILKREPLPDVTAFETVALYPAVQVEPPAPGSTKLQIRLKNRGGGIGRVQIFVNGKELRADARGPQMDPGAAEGVVTVDLSGAHLKPGEANDIRVVSWNQEGYLSSRGFETEWDSAGQRDETPPELYAIVAGISEYASPDFRLHFAAKDAEDFAKALQVGCDRLFGPARVHISLLTTSGHAGVHEPTKANLEKAFDAARQSKPGDVLVVYLSGHGVAIHDTYAYPTQEARTLDLTDPAVRTRTSITSEELVAWVNAIPALKQVMILDTCAAGAAQKKLIEKREVPGDQIRAIDRLKDRTGFYVLMGAAADAPSYEASQYGQGLLTYSLLVGMRGAALREEKFVDVSKLFQYAADEVPQLARNVGGVQAPLIVAPQGGASFDVGEIVSADKAAIPLAMLKSVILRPVLLNSDEGTDNLELMAALRSRLRDESYVEKGGGTGLREPNAIFVDEEEFPGGIRPSGFYTVAGQRVKVKLFLSRDGKKISQLEIEGSAQDRSALIDKIVAAMTKAIPTP